MNKLVFNTLVLNKYFFLRNKIEKVDNFDVILNTKPIFIKAELFFVVDFVNFNRKAYIKQNKKVVDDYLAYKAKYCINGTTCDNKYGLDKACIIICNFICTKLLRNEEYQRTKLELNINSSNKMKRMKI